MRPEVPVETINQLGQLAFLFGKLEYALAANIALLDGLTLRAGLKQHGWQWTKEKLDTLSSKIKACRHISSPWRHFSLELIDAIEGDADRRNIYIHGAMTSERGRLYLYHVNRPKKKQGITAKATRHPFRAQDLELLCDRIHGYLEKLWRLHGHLRPLLLRGGAKEL